MGISVQRERGKHTQALVSPKASYCQFLEPFDIKFSVKHLTCFWVTVIQQKKGKKKEKKGITRVSYSMAHDSALDSNALDHLCRIFHLCYYIFWVASGTMRCWFVTRASECYSNTTTKQSPCSVHKDFPNSYFHRP